MSMRQVANRGGPPTMRHVARRSGAASIIDPLTLSPVAWWDMSDITTLWKDAARTSAVTANGDIVLGVTDKSGAGRHLSVAANGPTYTTGAQNGRSVLRSDGVNDILSTANTTISQPFTLVYIGNFRQSEDSKAFVSNPLATTQLYGSSNANGNKWQQYAGTTANFGSVVSTTAGAAEIVVAIYNGASSGMYVNGGTAFTANVGSGGFANVTISLGARATGPADFSHSDHCEVLIFDAALSVANINALGAYASSRWGRAWATAS